jgi:hypothetical protein
MGKLVLMGLQQQPGTRVVRNSAVVVAGLADTTTAEDDGSRLNQTCSALDETWEEGISRINERVEIRALEHEYLPRAGKSLPKKNVTGGKVEVRQWMVGFIVSWMGNKWEERQNSV